MISNPTPGQTSKESKTKSDRPRYVHPGVHLDTVHHGVVMELPVSTHWPWKKKATVLTGYGIPPSHQKHVEAAVCNMVEASGDPCV